MLWILQSQCDLASVTLDHMTICPFWFNKKVSWTNFCVLEKRVSDHGKHQYLLQHNQLPPLPSQLPHQFSAAPQRIHLGQEPLQWFSDVFFEHCSPSQTSTLCCQRCRQILEPLHVWKKHFNQVMYQTQGRVFLPKSKHREVVEKTRRGKVFSSTSRCSDIRWKTLSNVLYSFSNH